MLLQAVTTTTQPTVGSPITAYWPVMIFFGVAVIFPVLPIILALRDENSDVRWTAAQCLGTTGDERAMSALEYVRDHDTGEATYNAYTTRLSEVAADAIWTIRRAKNPNLFKINGVECELQPDGTWKWLNDPDQPATGDSPNSDG